MSSAAKDTSLYWHSRLFASKPGEIRIELIGLEVVGFGVLSRRAAPGAKDAGDVAVVEPGDAERVGLGQGGPEKDH